MADPFPIPSEDKWRRVAGAAADRTAPAGDGIAIAPIYPAKADAAPLRVAPGWKIIHRVAADDADAAIRHAAAAIAGGADGIEIVFDSSVHPLRSKLPVASA